MVKLFLILTSLYSVMAISEFVANDYESARYFVILAMLNEIMAKLYEMEAKNNK